LHRPVEKLALIGTILARAFPCPRGILLVLDDPATHRVAPEAGKRLPTGLPSAVIEPRLRRLLASLLRSDIEKSSCLIIAKPPNVPFKGRPGTTQSFQGEAGEEEQPDRSTHLEYCHGAPLSNC